MNFLDKYQKILNYKYKNIKLLETALTHRSYLNEDRTIKESNERSEFLGDAVLELVTSEFLFFKFPQSPEGDLTSLRAKIVQTKTLAKVANNLGLGEFLRMSKGEAISGGSENESLLADTTEAVIGSIYLDGGYKAAKKFITDHILNHFERLIKEADVEDWKSHLQEVVQAKGGVAPTYKVVKEEGPDHDRTFTVQVSYFDKEQEIGIGNSKQRAQQEAAHQALEKLQSVK